VKKTTTENVEDILTIIKVSGMMYICIYTIRTEIQRTVLYLNSNRRKILQENFANLSRIPFFDLSIKFSL